MNHTPKIGAYVLETLTTGMYTNPFDCIREYVQNASDAILTAEQYKWLKQNTGTIELHLNSNTRTLTIRDNGTGQTPEEAIERLLNIGMSTKVYGQEAGFRGIGRLAGIAYCERLTFATTTKFSDVSASVSFDCVNIRKALSPDIKENSELSDLLRKNTVQDVDDAPKQEHWFKVTMENIDPNLDMFFDITKIEPYLQQVAPVEYDSQRFVCAPKIQKWTNDHGIVIPTVKMILKTQSGVERQIFKPYRTHYKTKRENFDIRIKDVLFFPQDISSESPAFWLWHGDSDLLGMIDDDKVAGIRFRRNNIAIGGAQRMAELFPGNEGRLNAWTIGEVHILADDIIPNARRDGFETTDSWLMVKEQLAPFIRAHCKACHDASSAKSRPTQKVVASAKLAVDNTKNSLKIGLSSPGERERLAARLDREISRVEKAHGRESDVQKQQLQSVLTSLKDMRERLDNKDVYASQQFKSNLDRKQRKVLKDVIGIIDSVLTAAPCAKSNECLHAVKKAISAKFQTNNDNS